MALITPSNQIPGFHCQPTLFDLQNSTNAYNELVDSEELRSEISTTHLQNLAEIFAKYNVHERLGIHLIHSHAKVAAGNVMLGHSFAKPSGRWAKPTQIEEVDLADIHGHIFKLVDGGRFVAYEYVEGKASNKEGFVSFKGNETHMETVKGPHKVLIDAKLAPNVTALKAILKRYEIIN